MPDPVNDFSWVSKKPVASTGSVVSIGGVRQAESQEDFDFTLKFNQNNTKLRAQNQSWYEQAGKTLGNIIPNIATGIVEGFAYIPELWDKDQDYSNAITTTMEKWKNPFGETYRENPDQVWDIKDPAWWFNNGSMLVESAAAFATEGALIGKAFSTIAKGAGTLVTAGRAGRMATNVANRTAQLATASTLAAVEGAMSGHQVYEKTYNNRRQRYINAGTDPAEADVLARKEAAEAAALTAKTSTAMNTILNMGIIAPMFRGPSDKVLDWYRGAGKRLEGESLTAYRTRIAGALTENPEIKALISNRSGFTSIPAEMLKEGLEEVNTQYAEQVGLRRGEGQDENLFTALTSFDKYLKDVTNEEGALNFVLGMVGGAAQTALFDIIPSKYIVAQDANGKPIYQTDEGGAIVYENGKPKFVKQLVRPKTYNERGQKEYFESVKESVLADIDRQQRLHERLVEAVAKKDNTAAEAIRSELFSITALDAVQKGMSDNWVEEYEQIARTDNEKDLGEAMTEQIDALREQLAQAETEEQKQVLTANLQSALQQQQELTGVTDAMRQGYATTKGDDSYKQRAKDAITDLKTLQSLHDNTQKQYVSEDIPISGEVADHIFFRRANLYLNKRGIQKEQARIEAQENSERMLELVDTQLVDREIDRMNRTIDTWNDTITALNGDVLLIQEATKRKDIKALEELIGKYKADGATPEEAMTKLVDRIKLKQRQYENAISNARTTMEDSVGYRTWLEMHPGKSFEEYLGSIRKSVELRRDKSNLELFKAQTDIAEQTLNDLETQNGIESIYKILSAEKKEALKKMEASLKKSNVEAFLREQNKKNAARLTAQEKAVIAARAETQLNTLREQFNTLDKRRAELEEQIRELSKKGGVVRNFNTLTKLKSELSLLKAQINSVRAQIKEAENRLEFMGVQAEVAAQQAADTEQQTPQQIIEEDEREQDDVPNYSDTLRVDAMDEFDPEAVGEGGLSVEELAADAEDPMQDYMNMLQALPVRVRTKVGELETEFEKAGKVSINRISQELAPFVSRGTIEQAQVAEVYFKMNEYFAAKNAPVMPATSLSPQQTYVEPAVIEDEPLVIHSEQPQIFINQSAWTDEGLEEQYWVSSPKSPTAVKVNSSDLMYDTIQYNGQLKMRTQTARDGDKIYAPVLDPTSNKDRMKRGAIRIGDDVELIPDVDWNGSINNHHTLEQDEYLNTLKLADKFSDYVDEAGKIRTDEKAKYQGYANVPIKIIHKRTGRVLGYYPMNDWVNATLGASNTRNVPVDVLEAESMTNLRIRKNIVERWNEGGASTMSKVTGRTAGRLMYAGEVNSATGKVKYQKLQTAKLIKDPRVRFGFVTNNGKEGEFLIGKGAKASTSLKMSDITPAMIPAFKHSGTGEVVSGPVMYLPMPNGEHMPVALETSMLNKKGDSSTVARLIEIHLRSRTGNLSAEDREVVGALRDDSTIGFDITTPQGLRNMLEQHYTYTSKFKDASLMLNAPPEVTATGEPTKTQKWLISIDDNGEIKIGTQYSGQAPIRATLVNGGLSTEFRAGLEAGLATRFKNVTFTSGALKGVNDVRPITSIIITEKGQLRKFKHVNYNEYLKTFTQTPVYGLHKIDGEYVYGANSQILLDSSTLLPPVQLSVIDLAIGGESVTTSPENIEDLDAALDDFSNGSLPPINKINPEGIPLTLENLTRLHNFTPVSDRNGSTPGQVYEYLNGLNIASLADGYNPFIKCS